MNADMLNRVMEAGKYQKKAIMALFPESMTGHIEVIEKELSAMFMEYAMEIATQCMQQKSAHEEEENTEPEAGSKSDVPKKTGIHTTSSVSKVRKVSIESD